jgi:hypothetical protein
MSADIERRLARLEREVRELRMQVDSLIHTKPWWESIAGTFERDPIYEMAMKLGRQYRRASKLPRQL